MRIAVFHNLPSGGAKRTLYEAVKQLTAKHQIDVFTLSCANHTFADLRPLVQRYEVFDFKPGPLLDSPFGRLNQAMRLVDLMRLQAVCRNIARKITLSEYDLALVHTCQFENSSSVLYWLTDIPTVYYCHEPLRQLYEGTPARPYDDNGNKKREFLNRIDPVLGLFSSTLKKRDRRNLQAADVVLVNSKFMQRTVKRVYGFETHVCYHGVDAELFQPKPTQKEGTVLSVGSLTPMKGFDFLLKSLAIIPKAERPPLNIASNFQNALERQYLQKMADDLDVELRLMDNVSDDRLVELYNQAQLVLYAPVREPFGLVPLEAMACGIPVVGIQEGGIPESVVHMETGLLTDRNPEHFSSAIEYLFTNASLGRDLGHKGREHVQQHWTWEQAAKRLENQLYQALSKEMIIPALA